MRFVQARGSGLAEADIRRLIAMALFHRDDARIATILSRSSVHLAVEEGRALGQITVTDAGLIESIAVLPESRGAGVGRFLTWSWLEAHPDAALTAETDDSAVGFYHHLGFRIRSLGEKYPGLVRYQCTFDRHEWTPPSGADVAARLRAAGLRFWISGGWAIDLFLSRQTRPHEDVDFDILRAEQRRLFDVFPGWEIYRTRAPGLAPWTGEPFLEKAHNVWLRPDRESPWACEAMFMDVDGDDWVYRRQPSVRRPLAEIGAVTADAIPYLRPEIQLLFKGGAAAVRERDTQDLLAVLPHVSAEAREWLRGALSAQFPDGHEWSEYLASR